MALFLAKMAPERGWFEGEVFRNIRKNDLSASLILISAFPRGVD